MAVKPTGEEMQLTEAVTPPPAETEVAEAPMVAERALPATASLLPLMALFGLLALVGALVLRATTKHLV